MSTRIFSAVTATIMVSHGAHAAVEESGCVSSETFAWPNISLKVGKTEQRRPVYRLNAGRMSPKMEKVVDVEIHNYLNHAIQMAVPTVDGNVRAARWANQSVESGTYVLQPNESTTLKIDVVANDPHAKGHVQLSDRCGSFISLISVRYREMPTQIHGSNTAIAWSGQRNKYSKTAQYTCIGAAPLGYKKIPGSEKYSLSGYRTVCGSWLNCFPERLRSEEVCMGASPQGNEKSNGQYATNVTVEADYQLVGSAPWLWD